MAKNEGREGHGGGMRFKRAWRHVNNEPSNLPTPAFFQFRRDQLIVPVVEKCASRIEFAKSSMHKRILVVTCKDLKFSRAQSRHWFPPVTQVLLVLVPLPSDSGSVSGCRP